MGRVMLGKVLTASIAIVAACLVGPVKAQPEPRIGEALLTLDRVMTIVTQAMIAENACDAGDAKAWFLVISTIDGRQQHCAKQDSRWLSILVGWDREIEQAKQDKLVDPGVGSYAYLRYIHALPEQIDKLGGVPAFCASAPWKILVNPNKDDPQVRKDFMRTNPTADIDAIQSVFQHVLGLGLDRSWIDTPCEKFWPFSLTSTRK